jgi:pimeloyl-ACP methyl ester carboxylesterase
MTRPLHYDEFGLFHENAQEYGLPFDAPPTVRREAVEVDEGGRRLSALVWGTEPPRFVLLHGGAQNAHTWDTVALALDAPLVAVDLPGHGHSDHRGDGPFSPRDNARDVAIAVRSLAPDARVVVGMSLGGLTAIALASHAPELVRRLALVDVTPGVDRDKAAPIAQFIAGPESFESFDEILARTIEFNPTRSESSLRRGVLHNAVERDDGRWVWRYQRPRITESDEMSIPADFATLWDDLGAVEVPLLLARGNVTGTVVDDADVAELLRRQPSARVEVVDGAGHSIQGDRPLELAALLADFAAP